MKTLSSRLSLKSDNAVCKSESFNDKHQAIEEPDEPKGSCPVLVRFVVSESRQPVRK
jgi:hypothetical protein